MRASSTPTAGDRLPIGRRPRCEGSWLTSQRPIAPGGARSSRHFAIRTSVRWSPIWCLRSTATRSRCHLTSWSRASGWRSRHFSTRTCVPGPTATSPMRANPAPSRSRRSPWRSSQPRSTRHRSARVSVVPSTPGSSSPGCRASRGSGPTTCVWPPCHASPTTPTSAH